MDYPIFSVLYFSYILTYINYHIVGSVWSNLEEQCLAQGNCDDLSARIPDPCDNVVVETNRSIIAFNDNKCGCRMAGCEYSIPNGTCINLHECQHRFSSCPPMAPRYQCYRRVVYYGQGGVLCKYSLKDHGNCDILETIIGVKATMDSNETIFDSRGVKYNSNKQFRDPGNTRQVRNLQSQNTECVWDNWKDKNSYENRDNDVSEEDFHLYKTMVNGKTHSNSCLSYVIPPMRTPGRYELSLKFLETEVKNSSVRRAFGIKMGWLTLINELDVYHYVGHCHPLEIIIPFEITHDGNKIQVLGFPSPYNNEPLTGLLSFCYGECPENSGLSYIISSFDIARVGNRSNDCQYYQNEQLVEDRHTSECDCQRNNYRRNVNLTKGNCYVGETTPTDVDCQIPHKNKRCFRYGVFYENYGLLSRNNQTEGNCTILYTLIGVKAALQTGKMITDSRNIRYSHEVNYIDRGDTRRTNNETRPRCDYNWDRVPFVDRPLFKTVVFGDNSKVGSSCLSYELPKMKHIGIYELSLKFLDTTVKNDRTRRTFTIKLGDMILISELDIYKHAGNCTPMEVIFHIEVFDGGRSAKVKGHSIVPNDEKHVGLLTFCYGKCSRNGGISRYIINAFYLAYLGNQEGKCEVVYSRASTRNNCTTQTTLCGCKNNRCEYSSADEKCVARSSCDDVKCPGNGGADDCLRAGAYYVDGGVLCKNEINFGICDILETVIATTTGGDNRQIRDSRNILHTREGNFDDPGRTRATQDAREQRRKCNWNWKGFASEDVELYKTLVFGNYTKIGDSCLSYNLPLMNNTGRYEMSLKFLENNVENDTRKRTFNVKFGNLTLINELDIFGYVGNCKPMEIIVPINITDNGDTIIVKGFPPMKNNRENAGKLSFCYGNCNRRGGHSTYIISAFYIVQLGKYKAKCDSVAAQEVTCSPNVNTECGCGNSECETRCQPSKTCEEKFTQCPGRCLRRGVFYGDGEVPCLNMFDRGSCGDLETVIGLSMGMGAGKYHVDSRNILYIDDKDKITVDYRTRHNKSINCKMDTKMIQAKDVPLYQTQIYGGHIRGYGFLTYGIPEMMAVGNYELSLKFLENDLKDDKVKRKFTVIFNDLVLLNNFDVYKYVGNCFPMEVIFQFEVTDGGEYIEFQGFPRIKNENNKLSYYYGSCKESNVNSSYINSAFYVAYYL